MQDLAPRPGLADIDYYMVGISKLPGFDQVIKLSSNESPLGASPRALEAAQAALADAHLYPEVDMEQLQEALAAEFGLDPAGIAFGPGSDELLTRLVATYAGAGEEVIHSAHAYMQFPIYAKRAGALPVAAADDAFRHDVDRLLACVTERTRVLIIANPDNPSGTYLSGAEVRRLRDGLPERVLLIVDAAYEEYADQPDYESATALVAERGNVVVTRTFSKVFGLAGLRLGWCYGPPEMIDLLNRIGPSFPVNVAAKAAGLAALADRSFTADVLAQNAKWRAWFADALRDLGLTVYPSQTNFSLGRLPRRQRPDRGGGGCLPERPGHHPAPLRRRRLRGQAQVHHRPRLADGEDRGCPPSVPQGVRNSEGLPWRRASVTAVTPHVAVCRCDVVDRVDLHGRLPAFDLLLGQRANPNLRRQTVRDGVRDQEGLARGLAGVLNAAGDVHRIADHGVFEPVFGPDVAGSDRAEVNADAKADLRRSTLRALGVEPGQGGRHRQSRTNRPFGIVVAGLRRAEGDHDAVADELVDGAAEAKDLLDHAAMVLGEKLDHLFGRQGLGDASEVAHVAKHDRDLLRTAADAEPLFGLSGYAADDAG